MIDTIREILTIDFYHNSIGTYLSILLVFLTVLLFKRLISKLIGKIILNTFPRIIPQSQENANTFVSLTTKPMETMFLVLAIFICFNILDLSFLGPEWKQYRKYLNQGFHVLIVMVMTWGILCLIDFLSVVFKQKAAKTESKTDDQVVMFMRETGKLMTIVFAGLFIIGTIFNIDIGTFIAGLGIGGLAIALAAQDTLSNFIASFVIFFDKPFEVGDLISVSGTYGVVEKIGFRSTRIRTLEKSYLTVPNNSLINKELDNLSLRTFRRAKFDVGLTYNTSIEQIKAIRKDIQQYIDDHEVTNEDGLVRFETFGESSLNLMVVYFVRTKDYNEYLDVREDINFKIMEIVKAHGSDFAFPSRTLYVQHSDPASKKDSFL